MECLASKERQGLKENRARPVPKGRSDRKERRGREVRVGTLVPLVHRALLVRGVPLATEDFQEPTDCLDLRVHKETEEPVECLAQKVLLVTRGALESPASLAHGA